MSSETSRLPNGHASWPLLHGPKEGIGMLCTTIGNAKTFIVQDFHDSGVAAPSPAGRRGGDFPRLCCLQASRDSGNLGFWNEDDLDMFPSEVRLLPHADGEGRDGSCRGLGQQSGPFCSPVDVFLLDSD